MSKRIFLVTLILVYAMSVNSFAAVDKEKNDLKRGEQKESFEPAFSGTIPIKVSEGKDSIGLVAKYKDNIVGLEKAEAAAIKSHTGSGINGISLNVENGYLVYNVLMDDGTDIIVDAGSANILHANKHTHEGNDETHEGNVETHEGNVETGLEQSEEEKGSEYSKET